MEVAFRGFDDVATEAEPSTWPCGRPPRNGEPRFDAVPRRTGVWRGHSRAMRTMAGSLSEGGGAPEGPMSEERAWWSV